jgi:diguanylate cyclase (GGDEF)-like protein
VLGSLAARMAVGEVEAVREAVRNVARAASARDARAHAAARGAHGRGREPRAGHQGRARPPAGAPRHRAPADLLPHQPRRAHGLPNRKALEERLESALSTAKTQGSTHALLYVDVDYFHRINDSYGHLAGDELLRGIVPVMQSTLREGETLARIGGDEFAGPPRELQRGIRQAAATQLRDSVQAWQFEWNDKAFQVGVSVGVVAITRLAPSLSAILSEADTACFTAKEQGRNRVFAFHDASSSQYMRQTSRGWLKRINDALTEGAFTLLYQPIVPIDAPHLVGVRAWKRCCA